VRAVRGVGREVHGLHGVGGQVEELPVGDLGVHAELEAAVRDGPLGLAHGEEERVPHLGDLAVPKGPEVLAVDLLLDPDAREAEQRRVEVVEVGERREVLPLRDPGP